MPSVTCTLDRGGVTITAIGDYSFGDVERHVVATVADAKFDRTWATWSLVYDIRAAFPQRCVPDARARAARLAGC